MREEVEKLQAQNGSVSAAKQQQQIQQQQQKVDEYSPPHSSHPPTATKIKRKPSNSNKNRSDAEEPSWMEDGSDPSSASDGFHDKQRQLQSSRASLDAEDRQKFGLLEVKIYYF